MRKINEVIYKLEKRLEDFFEKESFLKGEDLKQHKDSFNKSMTSYEFLKNSYYQFGTGNGIFVRFCSDDSIHIISGSDSRVVSGERKKIFDKLGDYFFDYGLIDFS